MSDKSSVRLDAYLAEYWPEHSRSLWQKYIKLGYVSVNGEVVTLSKKTLEEDDQVSFSVPDNVDFTGQDLPVLYKDEDVIVVNKPAGVLTHAKGAISDEFTVSDFFARFSKYNQTSNRPGIIHRLDRDTSGVIIGALNEKAAKTLQKQFANRTAQKVYLAIVEGVPKKSKAVIDLPIARNPAKPSQFRVDPNGKNAITEYEVISVKGNRALVWLRPKTGRTHQLRVHMSYLGNPIVGDKVYGKPSDRLYLHAFSLKITISSGINTTFTAPVPKQFKDLFPEVEL